MSNNINPPTRFKVDVIDSQNAVVHYYAATFNVRIFIGDKRRVVKSPVRFAPEDWNRLIATVLTAVEYFETENQKNESINTVC